MKERKHFQFPSVMFQFLEPFFEIEPTNESFDSLLTHLNVSKEQLRDPAFYIDGEQLFIMLELLKKNSTHHPPALRVLQHMSLNHMGMAGVAGQTAMDLNNALSIVMKFYKLVMPVAEIERYEDANGERLELKLISDYGDCDTILVELILGALKQFSDEATGEKLELKLEFSHPLICCENEEDAFKHYLDYFKCDVEFGIGGSCSRLLLNEVSLDKRLKTPNKILHNAAASIIDKELKETNQSASISEKVRELVVASFETEGPCSLDDIANQLHMTSRTLARKLAKEHIQYKSLLNEVRFERAKTLIERGDLTIKQIASKLRFSNGDTFSRAFKAYTGVTPSQWKETI